MTRTSFMVRRLLQGAATILIIALVNFLLVRAAPGDPAAVLAGEAGATDPAYVQQLRVQFGLDKPMLAQLGTYMQKVASLDLGYSYRQQRQVIDLIAERLPATLMLTGLAFVLSLLMGVTLGAVGAHKEGAWLEGLVSVLSMVFYATPLAWLAMMAVLVFSIQLDWLPAFGYRTVGGQETGVGAAADIAKHLILPVVTLSLFYMAVYARMTSTVMRDVARLDFVKTARAKGLAPRRILFAHVLRNALLPIITIAGMQAGALIGGAVLIETVFAWPGVGRLMLEALLQRDYPVLLGVFVVTASMAVVFNLLTDWVYTIADPRIELK